MLSDPRATHPAIADLVRRARAGEKSAWTELHGRYAPVLHGVALAHGPHPLADDVVQEAFTRALERLDDLREDAAFGGWICAIARNLATSGYRRQSRFARLTDIFFAPARPTVEAARAIAAIRSLPEAYRELLMLRLVEGMTGPDRLGRTPGSVRVSLHRGMKLLRAQLEGT